MNRITATSVLVLTALLFAGGAVINQQPQRSIMEPGDIHALFSPRGGITDRIVEEINHAEGTVYVQAYSFTSKPISEALIDAHERGVDVEVCADDSNKNPKTSVCDELVDAGIVVWLDTKHAISHSKCLVIDYRLVITGSFNLTANAEFSNLENVVVIRSTPIAVEYFRNYRQHRKHCVLLEKTPDISEVSDLGAPAASREGVGASNQHPGERRCRGTFLATIAETAAPSLANEKSDSPGSVPALTRRASEPQ